MSSSIAIRLFGDFTLAHDGQVVNGLDSARLQSLLAYLLLRCPAPQPRQHLAFLFWPDTSEAQARTNLRNLLHRLRQAWPDAVKFLEIGSKNIAWRAGANISLDVAKFEQHIGQAQTDPDPASALKHLEQAIQLHQRELLPNCYDEWILPERARLQQTYLRAIEQSAEIHEKQANFISAIQLCRQLIEMEPLSESYYRRLMRLHVLDDDRAAALRVYYHCATTLQRELDIAPDAATQEAYRRLLALDTPIAPLPLSGLLADTALIGRSLEWEQLAQTWQQVAGGHRPPLLAVISGEPGIGKTTLASELTGWIKRQGGTTASTACYAPETDLSLVPVVSWLRAISLTHLDPLWQAELARALPELVTDHPRQIATSLQNDVHREALAEPWQKRRFYEAMARAILSQQGPICLHIEDIQWADSETLSWLHYLLRLEQTAHLMVIATLRLEQTSSDHLLQLMLSTWRQQGRLAEIELPPLDEAATAALAASMLGEDLPAEISTTLYRQPCSLAQGRTGLAATL